MQYKTTIEVHTEADNKYEAADIAGEFLRGDISAGADVKVDTVPVAIARIIKVALAICSVIAISGIALIGNQIYYKIAKVEIKPVTSYAIQPPLKTNLTDTQSPEFKNIWKKAHKDRNDSIAR